jgi:hypothetical protein
MMDGFAALAMTVGVASLLAMTVWLAKTSLRAKRSNL